MTAGDAHPAKCRVFFCASFVARNGNLAYTERHYVETNNYSLKDKGYFEITSIVSALPSGATVKSIVATVVGYGGHLYVTGAGQENNKWYVAYVNWTGDATSVSRSVRVDIAYML